MVLLLGGAMLARTGAILVAVGAGRARFAATAAIRALLDLAVLVVSLTLAWFLGLLQYTGNSLPAFIVMIAGALAGTSLLSTTVAERARLRVALLLPALYGLLLLPLATRIAPVLIDRGFTDDGGSTYFHLLPGLLGLVASLAVGPRDGKFERDGSISVIPAHQLPLSLAGFLLMSFALCLTSAAIAQNKAAGTLHLLLALCTATLASAAYSHFRYRRLDPGVLITGGLAGLISASTTLSHLTLFSSSATPLLSHASFPGIKQAFVLPALAAFSANIVYHQLERRLKLDDLVGVISAQATGVVLALLLAPLDLNRHVLPVQLLGLCIFAAAALVPSLLLFVVLSRVTSLRVPQSTEYDGLDLATHDLNAYPDFSQPMIRSYHNREA